MNTANIPPAILQQLMAQMGNFQAQAEPESEDEDEEFEPVNLKPLTPSELDKKLAEFMSTKEKESEDFLNLDYGEFFLKEAFGVETTDEAYEILHNIYDGKELDQGVCGKRMISGMVGYSCLDCQMDSTCIICKDCFENGEHAGHRFQIKPHVSGMCDCGDPDAWKPEGNCKHHNGFISEDEYMSSELKMGFINSVKRFVFYIVQGLEINSKFKLMRTKYSRCFQQLVDMLKSLKEEYSTMACLIGRALCQTYDDNIEGIEGEFQLNHNCQDFTGEHPKDPKPQKCTCSVSSSLIRYIIRLSKKAQKSATSFFMGLFVHEQFKTQMAVEYLRMINFNIDWDRIGKTEDDKKATSTMCDMCIQLLTSEQLADLAIEKATIKPFFEGLIKVVQKYKSKNGYLYFDDMFYNSINLNLKYIMMKKSGLVRVLEDRESIKLYFLFLEEINSKAVRIVYEPKGADLSIEDNINSILFFEINTIRHWIEMLSNLASHKPEETEAALFTFLDEAKESIIRIRAFDDENYAQGTSVNERTYPSNYSLPLPRIFIVALVGYFYFNVNQ